LAEEVVEDLRVSLRCRQVEQALQREVGGRPAGLIHGGRFGEPVDRSELEELRTVLEVACSAGGECLESHASDYTTGE